MGKSLGARFLWPTVYNQQQHININNHSRKLTTYAQHNLKETITWFRDLMPATQLPVYTRSH